MAIKAYGTGASGENLLIGNGPKKTKPKTPTSSSQVENETDLTYSGNLNTSGTGVIGSTGTTGNGATSNGSNVNGSSNTGQVTTDGSSAPVTETPETGSTGSGSSSAGPTEVDSYEQFLLKQEGYYKNMYDSMVSLIESNKQSTIQQAEQQRKATEEQAETERQRGVIDARSSYAQNLATYGANAEALASMGLSGSGYSDYLNQQAYATQRAETQNANAQAQATKLNAKYTADAATLAAEQQANSDLYNAQLSYQQNLQSNAQALAQYQQQKAEQEKAEVEQRNQYYTALLTAANSGQYSSDQLASLAAQYGLDESQVAQLQAAADKYNSDQQSASAEQTQLNNAEFYRNEAYNIQTQGSDYDTTYLDMMLQSGQITQETYDSLMDQYASAIASEGNSDKLDDLHNEGLIDDTTYQAQIDKWNSNIMSAISSNETFGGMDYTTGKAYYEEVINNSWATEETKEAFKASYIRNFATDIAKQYTSYAEEGTVDINSDTYSSTLWGDFYDSDNRYSKQGNLLSAYVADAKDGKIKEGQIIITNYGGTLKDKGAYVYIGDGVFVKCSNFATQDRLYGDTNRNNIYVPSGYEIVRNDRTLDYSIYKK